MAFQQTSASDWRDLLSVLKAFAVSNGWTAVYDDIAAKGQLGLSNGSCHVAIGEPLTSGGAATVNPLSRNDTFTGGTVADAYLFFAMASSLNAGNPVYYGHPNSPQDTWDYTFTHDPKCAKCNDLVGPFTNVWLFADAANTYIHCVVQSSAERYSWFSIGNLDKKGMSHADVGYIATHEHIFWNNNSTDSSNAIWNWSSGGHLMGLIDGNSRNGFLHIPDGVLSTDAGFTAGLKVSRLKYQTSIRVNQDSDHTAFSTGHMLDYFLIAHNQLATGGIPLTSIPVLFWEVSNNPVVALGEYPGLRMVRIDNLNPGQEIKYGGEVWQVFPAKRKAPQSELWGGGNPVRKANSGPWGLAFRKEV